MVRGGDLYMSFSRLKVRVRLDLSRHRNTTAINNSSCNGNTEGRDVDMPMLTKK